MSLNIKLRDLLNAHDQCAPDLSIKCSLGDGFLYENNNIYQNIRNTFDQLGYKFTNKDFCNYTVMPYLALKPILEKKLVPYYDNVTVLREIENLYPNKFKVEELIQVKPNYTFHESAHCLADFYIKQFKFDGSELTKNSQKAFLLIMAESFANAVESMANIPNHSAEQRFFFEMNSYIIHNKKTHTHFKNSAEIIGLETTYQLVFISYLFANCLRTEISKKDFQQILQGIGIEKSILENHSAVDTFKKVFNHAFELSLDFRVRTTSFYFILSDIDQNIYRVIDFDITNVLKRNSFLKSFFDISHGIFNIINTNKL